MSFDIKIESVFSLADEAFSLADKKIISQASKHVSTTSGNCKRNNSSEVMIKTEPIDYDTNSFEVQIKTEPVDDINSYSELREEEEDTNSYTELKEEDTNYFEVRIKAEPTDGVNKDIDILSAPEDDLSRSWTKNIHSWNQYANYTPQWMVPLTSPNSFATSSSIDADFTPYTKMDCSTGSLSSANLGFGCEQTQSSTGHWEDAISRVILAANRSDVNRRIQTKRQNDDVKKIFPCYIVLTKVDPFIDPCSHSASFQKFIYKFKDCSNLCKTTFFKRQLESGKDVFNVKTPSKQKNYVMYCEKAEYARKKDALMSKMKRLPVSFCPETLELKKNSCKMGLGRANKTYSCAPVGFKEKHPPKKPTGAAKGAKLTKVPEVSCDFDYLKKVLMKGISPHDTCKNLEHSQRTPMGPIVQYDLKSDLSGHAHKTDLKNNECFDLSQFDTDKHMTVAKLQDTRKKKKNATQKKSEKQMKKIKEIKKAVMSKNMIVIPKSNVRVIPKSNVRVIPKTNVSLINLPVLWKKFGLDKKRSTKSDQDITNSSLKGSDEPIAKKSTAKLAISGFLPKVSHDFKVSKSTVPKKKRCVEMEINTKNNKNLLKSVATKAAVSPMTAGLEQPYNTLNRLNVKRRDMQNFLTLNKSEDKIMIYNGNSEYVKVIYPTGTTIEKLKRKLDEGMEMPAVSTQEITKISTQSKSTNAKVKSLSESSTSPNIPKPHVVILKGSQAEVSKLRNSTQKTFQYVFKSTGSSRSLEYVSSSSTSPFNDHLIPETISKSTNAGGIEMPSSSNGVSSNAHTLSKPHQSPVASIAALNSIPNQETKLAGSQSEVAMKHSDVSSLKGFVRLKQPFKTLLHDKSAETKQAHIIPRSAVSNNSPQIIVSQENIMEKTGEYLYFLNCDGKNILISSDHALDDSCLVNKQVSPIEISNLGAIPVAHKTNIVNIPIMNSILKKPIAAISPSMKIHSKPSRRCNPRVVITQQANTQTPVKLTSMLTTACMASGIGKIDRAEQLEDCTTDGNSCHFTKKSEAEDTVKNQSNC